jgi:hypothetical protein
MILAVLDLSWGNSRIQNFLQIAQDLGNEVRTISIRPSPTAAKRSFDEAGELIASADAFFLPNPSLFACHDPNHPAHPRHLQARVRNGARICAVPHFNDEAQWNWFLAPFDMTVANYRIHPSLFTTRQPTTSENRGLITLERDELTFIDIRMLRGVERVVLESPWSISYAGDSRPILKFTSSQMPIDAQTDLLPIPEGAVDQFTGTPLEWDAREYSCMATWYGKQHGAVIACTGVALADPLPDENRQLYLKRLRTEHR